jgi:hypothetical protein
MTLARDEPLPSLSFGFPHPITEVFGEVASILLAIYSVDETNLICEDASQLKRKNAEFVAGPRNSEMASNVGWRR